MPNFLVGPVWQLIDRLEPVAVPESVSFEGPYNTCRHVHQAFKRFGLDPKNLRHWHVLIWHLAGKPAGAPETWDKLNLFPLRMAVEETRARDPKKTDSEICRELSKSKHKVWGRFKAQTLRRKLQDSRKPSHDRDYQNFCDFVSRERDRRK